MTVCLLDLMSAPDKGINPQSPRRCGCLHPVKQTPVSRRLPRPLEAAAKSAAINQLLNVTEKAGAQRVTTRP